MIEIKTKASMATFNTPVQWWSHVATSVATILNLTAMTKNIVSRDQDAIRPLDLAVTQASTCRDQLYSQRVHGIEACSRRNGMDTRPHTEASEESDMAEHGRGGFHA
eukprot:COSAG02_NODE_2763_length_8071_cov_26.991846_3_plen_107_part_00